MKALLLGCGFRREKISYNGAKPSTNYCLRNYFVVKQVPDGMNCERHYAYTVAFFDRYLKDEASPLLTSTQTDPDMRLESRHRDHLQ